MNNTFVEGLDTGNEEEFGLRTPAATSADPTLLATIKDLQDNQRRLMAQIEEQQRLLMRRNLFPETPAVGGNIPHAVQTELGETSTGILLRAPPGSVPAGVNQTNNPHDNRPFIPTNNARHVPHGDAHGQNHTPHTEGRADQMYQSLGLNEGTRPTATRTHEVARGFENGQNGEAVTYLTKADLEEILDRRGKQAEADYDLRPPYPSYIAKMPYPAGYVIPIFPQYPGRGNAKLHLNKFIDALGMHSVNEELCMREFSKSLSDKAYVWYSNLAPESIHSWRTLARIFMAKFFTVEEKTTLTDLGKEKQSATGDLLVFVKRFRELTLDCTDPVSEETLVSMCIDGMLEDYKVHLENLRLSTFTQLMEAAKRTSLSVKKRNREVKINRGPMIVAAAEGIPENKKPREGYRGGGRNPQGGRGRGGRNDNYEDPPPYPAPMETILDFLRKAVMDGTITHPENSNPNPSATDKANPKYCAYHRRVDHATADCRTLKWIIHKKQKAGLVVLDGGLRDVEQVPYPHHEGGPRQRVNVIFSEGEIPSNAGEDYSMSGVGIPEHSINMLVNQKKFRTFFDAMGYSEPARRAAVNALAQVSNEFQECLIVPEGEARSSSSITFYEEDYMLDDPDHNCALYLEVGINGRKLPKSLVDTGAGVNILPRNVFEALGIPLSRVYATKMKVSGLGDIAKPTYGQVTLEINIGP